MQYIPHPLSELFPLMRGEEFVSLKANIKEQGLLEPIWLLDGQILDGRNRFRACQEVGVEPRFREYQGSDPRGFVVSLNLERRHLDESQRAIVAARLANMPHGGAEYRSANLPIDNKTSQSDAAEMLNVSTRSVTSAKKIINEGDESLIQAVEAGEVSIGAAVTITELPKDIQADLVSNGPSAVREAASEIRKAHVAHNSGDNEWYTPPEFIAAAKSVLGVVNVDPASNPIANEVVGAEIYYTAEDNGLDKDWKGKVWMNPPYASSLIGLFAEKLAAHVERGDVSEAIVLVNNATETGWFSRLGAVASALCFPKGRVKFWAPDKKATPLQGQAILYFGDKADVFVSSFNSFGLVAEVKR